MTVDAVPGSRGRRRTLKFLALAGCVMASRAVAEDAVMVFAAMTLKDALDRVVARYSAGGGGPVTVSYGPTGTLVQQIANGAPADILFSADSDWMDDAASHKLIQPATRIDLLRSQLVLIAPADSPLPTGPITAATPLAQWLGGQRLAICDPQMMPAGRYAHASLEALGLWPAVQGQIAVADTVRAAMLDVERHEAPLGIVFDTDAALDPSVKVLGTFAAGSHPPIVYPAALIRGAKPMAADVLRFLSSPRAAEVFKQFGYQMVPA